MTKFKLGAMVGFAAGWAVGSGRAAELLDQVRRSATRATPVAAGSSEANGFARSGAMAPEPAHRNVASA